MVVDGKENTTYAHAGKFILHMGPTSPAPIMVITIIRDAEWKGHVKKELVHVQEKSNNLVETSTKFDWRENKQVSPSAKHASTFKNEESRHSSVLHMPIITSNIGRRQKSKGGLQREERNDKSLKGQQRNDTRGAHFPLAVFGNAKGIEMMTTLIWHPSNEIQKVKKLIYKSSLKKKEGEDIYMREERRHIHERREKTNSRRKENSNRKLK